MEIITSADQIASPRLRQLYDYWQSKRRGGRLPRRADIDPAEIPQLMPNLLLVDIEQNPFRVRYRLVGTQIVEATGFEFTGKYLDEIVLPDDEGPFVESYQLAAERKAAVLARIKWRLDAETTGEYDACFLPLSEDGVTVDKVLAMECYDTLQRDFTLPTGRPLPGRTRRD
ncbi:MAG: PAS domain-containing protein [Bacteroidota bacterium]|nr:PAS domain-containing protein [Kiloniellaceae bacterium]